MESHVYKFISICSVILIVVLTILSMQMPLSPTGRTFSTWAQGGNVTQVDFFVGITNPISYWKGLFGNLTVPPPFNQGISNPKKTFNLSRASPDVQPFNISLNICNVTELYATTEAVGPTVNSGYINSLTPATAAMVDTFLGLPSNDSQSGTSVFTQTEHYKVGNNNHTLISTTLKSTTGSYTEGVLKRPGGDILVFVVKVVFGIGFDGGPVMYELMLPQPNISNITWYFFQDPEDTQACIGQSRVAQVQEEQPPTLGFPGKNPTPTGGVAVPAQALPISGNQEIRVEPAPKSKVRVGVAEVMQVALETPAAIKNTQTAIAALLIAAAVIAIVGIMKISKE